VRILVTGAGGLTGSEVVARLAERAEVVAVVRSRRPAAHPRVKVVQADCTDPTSMNPLIAECDIMVHVAGIRLGHALAKTNIGAIRRLVVVSSAGVYSRSRAAAVDYLAGEAALLAVRPEITIVRPTMVYGSERDRNVHHVIALADRIRMLPLIGGGSAWLQPIHYEDLARAVANLALSEGSGVVNAAGAERISISAAAYAILLGLGLRPRLLELPATPFLVAGRVVDRVFGTRFRERVERLREDRSADISPFVGLTGVSPRSFDVGVRDEIRRLRTIGALSQRA
jgi:nucleoside-diphosphate-sugar epimerase